MINVTKEKLSEWALSGIVGGVALTSLMGAVSVITGSWDVVKPFVMAHFWESAACASVVFGLGVVIGALIGRSAAVKQLKAKDDQIADLESELEKRPPQEPAGDELAGKERPEDPSEKKALMMEGFSRAKAKAIIKAYRSESYVAVGDCDNEIRASIQGNEGIFLREAYRSFGMVVAVGNYSITDDWRAFLRKEGNRNRLKEIAGID